MQRLLEKEMKEDTSCHEHNVHTCAAYTPSHTEHVSLSECTHIDVILLVALVQVVHDGGFMQFSQSWHVLHSIDARLVHRIHLLPGDLCLLQVQHLEDNKSCSLSFISLKKQSTLNLLDSWFNLIAMIFPYIAIIICSVIIFSFPILCWQTNTSNKSLFTEKKTQFKINKTKNK